ncbi:tyrosine phosphatase family-domain-containing protein [Mariannaea sp. PMI_226]|nr:tyrosine phosphatase family-domain-containing protein [Mariannaea sp. PMI_226]
MASKRSSHAYMDEGLHAQEPHPKPTQTPFRSRRSSRNVPKEEIMQVAKDLEDSQRSAISIREATAITRSQNLSTVHCKESSAARTHEATTMSLSSSSSSISSQSSEKSPAPSNGPPVNFGIIVPGVYRSSYPKPCDFDYIKNLKLKTVVTLVKKDERDHDLETLLNREGIRQIVFNMKGTKKESIPLNTMKSILSIVLNKENYPLMVHCNHGKHRTGCVVGIIRKVSGWDTSRVLDEYKAYAEPKARECDLDYIRAFQVSSLRLTTDDNLGRSPRHPNRTFFRSLLFSFIVMALWAVSGSQLGGIVREEGMPI